MALTRRALALALALAGCSCGFSFSTARAAQCRTSHEGRLGCSLVSGADQTPTTFDGIEQFHTSGDEVVDRQLNTALNRMCDVSGRSFPYFAMYADGRSPNAFATDQTVQQGRRGGVFLGQTLFQQTRRDYESWDIAILAIIAHEFGHLSQYFENYDGDDSFFDTLLDGANCQIVLTELHADYMAGYYLGKLKAEFPAVNTVGMDFLMRALGSIDPSEPDFHGTGEQRATAFQEGYSVGHQLALTYRGALTLGAEFVAEHFS